MGSLFEVVLILVLMVANGVFAMSETAIVASRRARLQQRAEEGDAKAARELTLAEDPNVFLATVQIGITLIGSSPERSVVRRSRTGWRMSWHGCR